MAENNSTPGEMILHLDLRRLLAEEPKPIEYVLPSLPAGSVGVLSGAGGTGKSMLALQLLYMVSAGNGCDFSLKSGAWNQPEQPPAKAVYLSAEDTAEILHHRLYAINQHFKQDPEKSSWLDDLCDLIKVFPLVGTGFTLMDSHGRTTAWYQSILTACEGAKIVFIDTMRRSHDADENDNGLMSIFLKIAETLAKQTGASVVLLHHENKAGQGDNDAGAGALRGASAIVDNARWVARVQRMTASEAKGFSFTESERSWYMKLSLEKTNYGPPLEPIWLKRIDGGVLQAEMLIPMVPMREKKEGRNAFTR